MHASAATLDKINSFFELGSVLPTALSFVSLWRAQSDEAVSLTATAWWFIYLCWVTFYLWAIEQPISSMANAATTLLYGGMLIILVVRRCRCTGAP